MTDQLPKFNVLDYQLSADAEQVLLYYKGPFDEVILARIGQFLRQHFAEQPRLGSRLFSVFIELAQNIAYYSVERSLFASPLQGVGTILILKEEQGYSLTAGNLVRDEQVAELRQKCEELNALSPEELNERKRHIRSAPRRENHKGGSIGLIQVAIKAACELHTQTVPAGEGKSFFSITTYIEE